VRPTAQEQYRSAVCFIEGRRCVRPTATNNIDQRCALLKGVGACVLQQKTIQISGVLYLRAWVCASYTAQEQYRSAVCFIFYLRARG